MAYFQRINFVKQNTNNNNCNKLETNTNQLNGNEIKEFYENVISSEDPMNEKIKNYLNNKINVKTVEKRIEAKTANKSIKFEAIFKYCQSGQLEECLQWIQMGFDVNTKDSYLWTPLMCSSCAGHQDIVRLLLRHNADISAKDRKARNAFDLALINGHKDICDIITRHRSNRSDNSFENWDKRLISNKVCKQVMVSGSDSKRSKRCDVCGYQYSESSVRHNCSIVHQIQTQIQSKTKQNLSYFYEIPERNKGFEMMLRSGWTRDRGLGPDGSGAKAPIKTVLKRDRLGLGLGHNKPKVTHFRSYDEKSVENRVKQNKSSKNKRRKQLELKSKLIEIKFRQQFK